MKSDWYQLELIRISIVNKDRYFPFVSTFSIEAVIDI